MEEPPPPTTPGGLPRQLRYGQLQSKLRTATVILNFLFFFFTVGTTMKREGLTNTVNVGKETPTAASVVSFFLFVLFILSARRRSRRPRNTKLTST